MFSAGNFGVESVKSWVRRVEISIVVIGGVHILLKTSEPQKWREWSLIG
jgi:hypothetical protein